MRARPDEGVLFIEAFEGAGPEKQHEARENAKGASRIGIEPLHFDNLVGRRPSIIVSGLGCKVDGN